MLKNMQMAIYFEKIHPDALYITIGIALIDIYYTPEIRLDMLLHLSA